MTKDSDKRAEWTAQEGKSTASGKAFNPTQSEARDESAEAADDCAVDIGRPVSRQVYDHLKEQARRDAPLSGGTAQEDSSGGGAADTGEDDA